MKVKPNSFAFCGGAFGDEGKGRIVDEYVDTWSRKGPVVVYRDNGGANAGHTLTLPDGRKIGLHQLPSGIFCKNGTVILGKEMVLHPTDLAHEIKEVIDMSPKNSLAKIMIDEMAVLSLDTHRAFETVLKTWQEGSKGSTGRGISPAYVDVLLRHPLRMRDLKEFNHKKFQEHYKLYEALVKGLGTKLAAVDVVQLQSTGLKKVGSLQQFMKRIEEDRERLSSYIKDVTGFIAKTWSDKKYTYVFEKGQGIGLDYRWGVYPDVTASITTVDGIFSSTEGAINPQEINVRAGVIKATYMSSVGTRKLPSEMEEKLAHRIREDAHEYGTTTGRPRGIAYLDLVALAYYAKVGNMNYHVLTHMDIVYPDVPIKVCVGYTINGKRAPYRPDQEYLSKVKPVYKSFKPWNQEVIQKARKPSDIPTNAQKFLTFVSQALGTKILMITTGPTRNQSVAF